MAVLSHRPNINAGQRERVAPDPPQQEIGTFLPSSGGGCGMAARGSRDRSTRVELPTVVPFDIPQLSRLRWRLGSRTVDDEGATRRSRWADTESQWRLAVFAVADGTVVLRIRTPVGRTRFYGAEKTAFANALPSLEASDRWRRLD
jgi:hypothetical protein